MAATGSGKTLVGVEAANRLSARRVLVLVPTLDLLTQMARAWRQGGRHGAMVGVCSLRAEESDGIPCTTNPDELAEWVRGLDVVTVFATYASVGMGVLQRAHEAGLPVWSLMIIDEAHRTSGDAGKPWAAVHDQERIPAVRRLYMTATARVWEAEGGVPRLIASMDEDSKIFGPVAYKLKLSEGIRRGIIAPYQVLCLDIRDPELHAALLDGGLGSGAARGARMAAIQAGLMRAAAEERIRRVLSFHSRVGEAEAMAAGVPAVAATLAEDDPELYPPVERVWADWLYGEHSPAHRRQVLEEFASDFVDGTSDIRAALRVLSSVKVLGEGVDTAECDAVLFADARGSMVDIVQMVGRALRTRPGRGKLATLIVPVFLGPGESGDEMVTSDAYKTLSKVLGALRAHDTDTIEALADPRVRSGRENTDDDQDQEHDDIDAGDVLEDEDEDGYGAVALSRAAAGVLRFSEERDPAVLAQFVRLRVIDPEGAYWRRGVEAAGRWLRETGNTVLRVPYTVVTPEDWGGVGGYPLGQWIADQRRTYAAGTLEDGRVAELEKLGMVWSEQDAAWADGIAVAKEYAAVHGHFLPPTTAVWEGHPIGVWAKNARASARRARENEELRTAGLPVPSSAGAMTEARRDELDAIDPGWCPAWDTAWQRCYRLVHNHVQADGTLPTVDGDVVVQGEDLGRWVNAQRFGWEQLLPVQQWILENTLSITPAEEHERPVKQTQDTKWAANLAAARQFHAREGHLRVPRKHVERLEAENALSGRQGGTDGVVVKLGTWLDNVRKRAAKLPEQRRTDLDQLGMRW
ncbi:MULTISPECIES: DEAD/DEAH box helicase [unclassified Streptomyces]|uniref:DEAD/DEAH box helicase n=1 Tax=unclassified Streptomyces TaxID=2593676 RepID=UPI002B1E2914|nr:MULTISPECIES: Helicase associated domain protein [unclassified Streptomyces]